MLDLTACNKGLIAKYYKYREGYCNAPKHLKNKVVNC